MNERRISELEDLIAKANVVTEMQSDNVVTIGRHVAIQNTADKKKRTVHLVGATESDPLKGKVSIDSPLGKALLNSRLGEVVTIETPSQQKVGYKILAFAD
jgi:transcription elongation factor GreA